MSDTKNKYADLDDSLTVCERCGSMEFCIDRELNSSFVVCRNYGKTFGEVANGIDPKI